MAFDLGAMLRDVSELDTGREQIEYIRLDLIDSDPNNFYQLTDIDKLADNISLCGLQQPIRVRQQENGRYMIVSGHRRRAALEMLVADGHEKFQEASCIVERDEVSPALQQLRLIYANANTRKLSDAELSEQAVQVEKLLYQLKEDGYDFPGRMRDHVAEAVGASKTKLARLKVIRKKLAAVWNGCWTRGEIGESVAYALAQMPKSWQSIIYSNWGANPSALYERYCRCFRDRFANITKATCSDGSLCENAVKMMEASCRQSYMAYCSGCCLDCPGLRTCKYSCPKAESKKKEMKAVAKKATFDAKREQEERDHPAKEFAKLVWQRLGHAREFNNVSVEALVRARGENIYNAAYDDPKQEKMERGQGDYGPNSTLSFGYSIHASDMMRVVAVANALHCSVDYLLGRTDRMELVSGPDAGWKTGDPWDFGEYVVLVRYNSTKPPVPKKISWAEDGWDMFGSPLDEIFPDATIVGWMPMPDEADAAPQSGDLLASAIDVIRETGVASVSMLQRKLKLGYAAASALMEQLEQAGVVGPYNGSKPREILMDLEVKVK